MKRSKFTDRQIMDALKRVVNCLKCCANGSINPHIDKSAYFHLNGL